MATNTLPTREQFLQGSIIKPDTCSICLETFDEKRLFVRIDTPDSQHVSASRAPRTGSRTTTHARCALAKNFVDSLLAKIADHANTNRELKVCHLIFFVEDAHALHGMEYHIPHDNVQYALMGVLFSMFCTVKFDNGRCSDDTRFCVYHVGRALGWPAHVTGDNPDDENEDEDEDEDDNYVD